MQQINNEYVNKLINVAYSRCYKNNIGFVESDASNIKYNLMSAFINCIENNFIFIKRRKEKYNKLKHLLYG